VPAPRKVSTTVGHVLAPYAGRGGFARTFGTALRSDVPCCPGPGKEQFAGAPHRGSPPTGDVSDGMVSDARVVAKAATMDCASTGESQPPQRRVVIRVPTVARPFWRLVSLSRRRPLTVVLAGLAAANLTVAG
jgi:hypothetical protein